MEVTNRFTGLDLIHRVPEELWIEVHDTEQEAVVKKVKEINFNDILSLSISKKLFQHILNVINS